MESTSTCMYMKALVTDVCKTCRVSDLQLNYSTKICPEKIEVMIPHLQFSIAVNEMCLVRHSADF